MTFDLDDFLIKSHKAQASDIHINCNKVPSLRINGEIYKISQNIITLEDIRAILDKTLPKEYAKKIDKSVFPGCQGGPLEHIIAGKAVVFKEDLRPEFKNYCEQVIKNAKILSNELQKYGFTI